MRLAILIALFASTSVSFAKPISKVQAQLDRMEYQIQALSGLLERQSRIQNTERHAIEANQTCIEECDARYLRPEYDSNLNWKDTELGKCVESCPKVPKTVYGGGC